jgi:hypothetical protein
MSMESKIDAMIKNSNSIRSAQQQYRVDYSTGLGSSVSIFRNNASVHVHTKPDSVEEEVFNALIGSGVGSVVDFEEPETPGQKPFRTVTIFLNGVEITMFGRLDSEQSDVLDNQLELF